MASFNRVIIAGNLTRDPELRYTPNGTAVTEIGVAVNDRVKVGGEWTDQVTFVDVTVWGGQAENVVEYLGKGSGVLVEGRLKLDMWENNGEKRSKLVVVAEKVQFLDSKGSKGNGNGGGGKRKQAAAASVGADSNDDDSDIPF